MPSRSDASPTPAELAVWMQVAAPATAQGVFRWDPVDPDAAVNFAWGGSPPAVLWSPPGQAVRFWHAAPDRWRVEAAGELLAVSSGDQALAWSGGNEQTGTWLLQPLGPGALLRPSMDVAVPGVYQDYARFGGHVPTGTVEPAELLGRACWKWTLHTVTWWLDEASGCALRRESPDGVLELLEFVTDGDLDEALFALPRQDRSRQRTDGAPPRLTSVPTGPQALGLSADASSGESGEPAAAEPARRAAGDDADFTVTWWPFGALSYPVSGDPDVPEVLLVLNTGMDRPAFHLGVAPAGRRAPARQRARVRRWDGDGWTFALSWVGDVPDEDVDRIIASMPGSWA